MDVAGVLLKMLVILLSISWVSEGSLPIICLTLDAIESISTAGKFEMKEFQ